MSEYKLLKNTCPKCGNIFKERQIAKIDLGLGIQVNLMCEDGHKWSEFYTASYRGYWWDGKKYNVYGEVLKNEND